LLPLLFFTSNIVAVVAVADFNCCCHCVPVVATNLAAEDVAAVVDSSELLTSELGVIILLPMLSDIYIYSGQKIIGQSVPRS
jgi:hypothetical protein